MARERFARYNVVATFPDMEHARKALLALEQHGVEADNISLLGRAAEQVESDLNPRERDTGVAKEIAKGAGLGTAIGTGAGGVVGFIGGLLAWGIPGIGPVVGTAIWAATVGGAGVGAAIGGLVGGTAVIGQSEAWEKSFEESVRTGRVLVGVHADSREDIDKATGVLRDAHPLRVDHVDPQGRLVQAA